MRSSLGLNQQLNIYLIIKVNEFGVSITERVQPDLQYISKYYQHGNGNFSVYFYDDYVVGTSSLIEIGRDMLALRKMFFTPILEPKPLPTFVENFDRRTSQKLNYPPKCA